mgnify:CR=1 FL=1
MANKRFKRLPSGRIQYHGETYAGFNKPKRAPKGSKKKFVVLGKEGDKIKKVGYGHRDYSDFTKHKNPKRRANFRARHNCKTAKDKTMRSLERKTKLFALNKKFLGKRKRNWTR